MFELNATCALFVVSFLLFMLALNELFLKPVGEVIEKRQSRISNDLASARELRDEASVELAKYEKQLSTVREEARTIIADLVAKSQSERALKMAEIEKEGRTKLDTAHKELAGERTNLITALVEEEKALVQNIVSKLLGKSVSIDLDSEAVKKALVQGGK
ncbi:MAG: hypothetical protein SFY67_19120 [Candidatus Melainabacteria bacterium]|nr:hypothetical protein [Candidatus Melainabacteria bacterium]